MLAIAAALAAALCCLPVAAQNTQANEILILNDKPVTFSEFLKTYPDNDARAKALSPLPRETKRAFRDWEMAQLKKHDAEVSAQIVQVEKERAEASAKLVQVGKERAQLDIAMKLSTELNTILDELVKEQGASKHVAPEQQIINKKRAMTIMAALANPDIAERMKPQTVSILKILSNNLQKGGNLTQMNSDLIKNLPN